MTLHIELQQGKQWYELFQIQPGTQPGSLHDVVKGTYIFECKYDNSESNIYKAKTSINLGRERISDRRNLKHIQTLRAGESLTLSIQTKRMPRRGNIRFIHN